MVSQALGLGRLKYVSSRMQRMPGVLPRHGMYIYFNTLSSFLEPFLLTIAHGTYARSLALT